MIDVQQVHLAEPLIPLNEWLASLVLVYSPQGISASKRVSGDSTDYRTCRLHGSSVCGKERERGVREFISAQGSYSTESLKSQMTVDLNRATIGNRKLVFRK